MESVCPQHRRHQSWPGTMEGPLGPPRPPRPEPARRGAAAEGQAVCTSEVNSRGPTETMVGFEGRNVLSQAHLPLRKFPREAGDKMASGQLRTPPPPQVLQAGPQALGVRAPPSTEGCLHAGGPDPQHPAKAVRTCGFTPSQNRALERTLGRWRQATSQQALRETLKRQPWSPDPRSPEGKAHLPQVP